MVIVGNSGSGKTTLAGRLAARKGCDHIELDSLYHLEDWRQAETGEFRAAVAARVAGDRWVACGNYASKVADLVWARADTMVVFDFPRRIVMWRVVRRTLRRMIRREELWNGNREPISNLFAFHDPERNIIRWAWSMHRTYAEGFRNARTLPHLSHLEWIVLHDPREADEFLARATE